MSDASWGLIPYPKTRRRTDRGALRPVPTTLHTQRAGQPTSASRFRAWSLPARNRSAVARHRYLDLARRDAGVPHACRRPAPGYGRLPRSVRHVVTAPMAGQHLGPVADAHLARVREHGQHTADMCVRHRIVVQIEASIRRLADQHRDTLDSLANTSRTVRSRGCHNEALMGINRPARSAVEEGWGHPRLGRLPRSRQVRRRDRESRLTAGCGGRRRAAAGGKPPPLPVIAPEAAEPHAGSAGSATLSARE